VNGSERFTRGMHRGKTFDYVARHDPSYHLCCRAVGNFLNSEIDSYEEYFDLYGDHQAALQGGRERPWSTLWASVDPVGSALIQMNDEY
jgi:hypothetical protein